MFAVFQLRELTKKDSKIDKLGNRSAVKGERDKSLRGRVGGYIGWMAVFCGGENAIDDRNNEGRKEAWIPLLLGVDGCIGTWRGENDALCVPCAAFGNQH